MDSFYGGKPGSPFILKAAFETTQAMREAFMRGPEYKDVWYGEYCIIDSVSNNSYDNGKIYRRTFNYNDKDACAEYVCKITGPEGGTPFFRVRPISQIEELINEELVIDKNFVIVDDDGSPIEKFEPDTRMYPTSKEEVFVDSENNNEQPDLYKFSLNPSDGMVPGYEIVENENGELTTIYNDAITYTWCSEKTSPHNQNNPGQSVVHLGFEVPYIMPIFNTNETLSRISGIDFEHPFAPVYDLEIAVPGNFTIDPNTGDLGYEYIYGVNPDDESAPIIPCILESYVDDAYQLWLRWSIDMFNEDKQTVNGKEGYWHNYGYIKDEDGIVVYGNVGTVDDLANLNPEIVKGRVVTVTDDNGVKQFYAYDYINKEWYCVGSLTGSGIEFIDKTETSDTNNIKDDLHYIVTSATFDAFPQFFQSYSAIKPNPNRWTIPR